MIGIPGNIRVYLACGVTDMRKGFDGLAARVQIVLQLDPHGGALFVFRGRRGRQAASRASTPRFDLLRKRQLKHVLSI